MESILQKQMRSKSENKWLAFDPTLWSVGKVVPNFCCDHSEHVCTEFNDFHLFWSLPQFCNHFKLSAKPRLRASMRFHICPYHQGAKDIQHTSYNPCSFPYGWTVNTVQQTKTQVEIWCYKKFCWVHFPRSSPQTGPTASSWAASQDAEHLEWEKVAYVHWATCQLPFGF